MKYLFFDIECSNCFQGIGKICEFGYVIVDEKFNVLNKNVFVMSPGRKGDSKFDRGIYKRDPKFQWAYEIEYYYECEEYPYFYNKIKALLENQTIVLGFSVDNDISYLIDANRRYNKGQFDYKVFDVQKLANALNNTHRSKRLAELCRSLCGSDALMSLNPHLSRDDAMMTMLVIKKYCEELSMSLDEILNTYPHFFVSSLDEENKKDIKILNTKYKQICDRNRKDDYDDIDTYRISDLIKNDYPKFKALIEKIDENNICIIEKLHSVKYLICLNNEEMENLKQLHHNHEELQYITYDEFMNLDKIGV